MFDRSSVFHCFLVLCAVNDFQTHANALISNRYIGYEQLLMFVCVLTFKSFILSAFCCKTLKIQKKIAILLINKVSIAHVFFISSYYFLFDVLRNMYCAFNELDLCRYSFRGSGNKSYFVISKLCKYVINFTLVQ